MEVDMKKVLVVDDDPAMLSLTPEKPGILRSEKNEKSWVLEEGAEDKLPPLFFYTATATGCMFSIMQVAYSLV